MRGIVKASRRPPAARPRDRGGGFPRLSGGVARGLRCPTSPRHALLAESLGKPSLWVIISETWYYSPAAGSGRGLSGSRRPGSRAAAARRLRPSIGPSSMASIGGTTRSVSSAESARPPTTTEPSPR